METTILKASEGKVLRRISDGWVVGEELYLGYTYYIAGRKLVEPLLELPEHYEEVDAPEPEESEILDSSSGISISS